MKITTSFESLTSGLDAIANVINDKLLADSQRVVYVWCNGGNVSLVGDSGQVVVKTDIEANVDDETVDKIYALNAKALYNTVAAFKGLHRTCVSSVCIDIVDALNCRIYFTESSVSDNGAIVEDESDVTDTVSKFRIQLTKVIVKVEKDIREALSDVDEGVSIDCSVALMYFNALVPLIEKDIKSTIYTNMYVSEDNIYVVPMIYAAIMKNKLPSEFSGFVLSASMAAFVQSFFASAGDYAMFFRKEEGNLVTLGLRSNTTVAIVRAASIKNAISIDAFNDIPKDCGVVLYKDYLVDVLRRMKLSDMVSLSINLDTQTFSIKSEVMTQKVNLISSRGTGSFEMTLQPSLLSDIIMTTCKFSDVIMLYFKATERGIVITATDSMQTESGEHLWHTQLAPTKPKKGKFNWD